MPPGDAVVTFEFRPASLVAGAVASASTVVGLLILGMAARWRHVAGALVHAISAVRSAT
jgi:hypothetical protein